MMKTLALGLLLFCAALAGTAESEMRLSPKKIREEVRAVVEEQLAAFRAGDFAHAYSLASAGIKAQFNERLFAALIRRGYPALLRPGDPDLGVVRDQDGEQAEITVAVADRQKRSIVYRFLLVKEEAGWRINGVLLDQNPTRSDI